MNESEKILQHLSSSDVIKPIASSLQAIEFDRYTVSDIKIPVELLMENAGKSIADMVSHFSKKNPKTLIFSGPGNNGADAIVTARHLLAQNLDFFVYLIFAKEKWSQELKNQLAMLEKALICLGKKPHQYIFQFQDIQIPSLPKFIVIIDGIFGAGISRIPSDTALQAILFINNFRQKNTNNCRVISIDVPSGLSLEARIPKGCCVAADFSVTFEYLKRAHISEPTKIFCGKSSYVSIGLFNNTPIKNSWIFKRKTLQELFLPVKSDCHKGNFGHTMIFEGHPRYIGASRLCAKAALRAGVGLVTIATEEFSPKPFDLAEFMRCKRSDISSDLLKKIDALVIGPGLSTEDSWQEKAFHFINNLNDNIPFIVFDADGLMLLKSKNFLKHKIIVATPHAKEAANLLACTTKEIEQDRFLAIEELANKNLSPNNRIIWVLKGSTTLVRSPDGHIFAFRGGMPVLSAAGSGDILSGTIAGLYRQAISPLAAVLLGISLQNHAARILSKKIFKGILASELADIFPMLTKRKIFSHYEN
jgi:ADP-dependent NAD(P)H-hydrate dehydratase / NAD(P)H-hydrate epimerase